ncbi:hypothetical protein [Actinokineospora sp.]
MSVELRDLAWARVTIECAAPADTWDPRGDDRDPGLPLDGCSRSPIRDEH